MSRRAMSVGELLVAMALAILLVTMMVEALSTLVRASRRALLRASLQQSGVTLLLKLIGDLERANAGGITLIPGADPTTIQDCLIHPVRDVASDGLPVYSETELDHYRFQPELRQLARRGFSEAFPSPIRLPAGEPLRFGPEEVDQLLRSPAHTTLYSSVRVFRIGTEGVDPGFVGNPLRITVVFEQTAAPSLPPERIECVRSVALRTSL